ncbi:MAG: YCF48-related protein [Pirellulaceae bacterium]
MARLRLTYLLLGALAFNLAVVHEVCAQPAASPPQMLADAELTSVCFVNADLGWAVGDRGAIWHTLDGGRNWQTQRSPATCRLETVQFLDPENGWAVGGWTHPYTHQTSGIVLRTRDGGKNWQIIPDLTLPALKVARFFDHKRGWAAGDGSSLYPGGVFRTEDGGRTWIPIAKGRTLGWTAADFRNGDRYQRGGVVAGRGGEVAIASMVELKPARTNELGTRYLRRLVLAGESGGWLVGDGALALTTKDGGFTWSTPPSPLPEAARDFDFRAVAVHGNHCWIAGNPGSCIFHSHDGGQTWQTYRTEQSLPLRSLTFLDENRGWAVGSLGTILATRDGGRTWREQRRGGTRAAMLGIFSEPGRVPLEVFAQQSGNEAYLGAVEIICRFDEDATSREASLPERTHEALLAVGGSQVDTAWRFPLRPAEIARSSQAILKSWNDANDGKSAELLEEHLVRRIRTWRPEVILTEDLSPRGENPLAHLTNQIVLAATEKAADATAYSDQLTLLGLEAWRVKKVFAVQDSDKQGTVNITPGQWAPRTGRSLAESAEQGRSLLGKVIETSPRNIGLSLLVDHLPQQTGRRDVLSGIALLPGGEARRELCDPPGGDLNSLFKAAEKRNNVMQLIGRLDENSSQGASWLGQVDDLTKGLGDRGAGEILYQLATRYQAAGKSEYAAQLHNVLLTKHPNHPLADASALWLVQYYASSEAGWRQRGETRFSVGLATAELPLEEQQASGGRKPPDSSTRNGVAFPENQQPDSIDVEEVNARGQGVESVKTAAPGMNSDERAGQAIALAKTIEKTRPRLYSDPAFRFALATAHRQHGQPRNAEKLMTALSAAGLDDAWTACATAEQWLAHPSPTQPKRLLPCLTAGSRPKLDGKLNDPVWQQVKSVGLQSPRKDDADWPAVVVTAFDKEFLYIGASCRKPKGAVYTADTQPRKHDADLAAHDRVEICLDIDRDYGSYWKLAIDSRGFTADSCFGDATWNPTWYVASGGDAQFWTFEAAIPLAELTPRAPRVSDVWSVGIQRIIPNIGQQSFTQPASIPERGETFGLMVFE